MARFFSRRSGVSMVPSSLHAVSRTSTIRRVGRFVYLLSASLRRRGKDPKRSTFEDGA